MQIHTCTIEGAAQTNLSTVLLKKVQHSKTKKEKNHVMFI